MRSLLIFLLSLTTVSAADNIQVFFSPNGGCTQAIVQQLNQAKKSLLVQAYSFTSAPIAKAVVEVHKRGIRVKVILDKSQRTERYSPATFLQNSGLIPLIDSRHAIAHNKVMVIDGQTVITGFFNFTKAAEQSNAENLLIIHDPSIAAKYEKNWHDHQAHSEAYEDRRK